jgi:signal transduction histidine kinase
MSQTARVVIGNALFFKRISRQGLSPMVNSRFRSQVLENRLDARDLQLQLAAEAAHLGFWTWEPATGDVQWSARCLVLLGVAADGPPVLDTLLRSVSAEDLPRVRRSFAQALQTRREFAIEFGIESSAGSRRVHCAGRPHASGVDRNQPAFSGILREMRSGSMALRIESLHEVERSTLVTRLRSEIMPDIGRIQARIAALLHSDTLTSAVRTELDELAKETATGFESVRRTIFELQPPGVAELGLQGAVERYATEQAAAAGITLSLTIPHCILPLGSTTQEALYVVARTGIDNVVRHARAQHMSVTLDVNDDEVVLRVIDDGVGIRDSDLAKDSAYSLFASSERLAGSGGELRVAAAPERGTRMEAIIPLRHKQRKLRHNVNPLRVA